MKDDVILLQVLGSSPKLAAVKLFPRSKISGPVKLYWYANAVDNAPGANAIVVEGISFPTCPQRSVAKSDWNATYTEGEVLNISSVVSIAWSESYKQCEVCGVDQLSNARSWSWGWPIIY